MIEKIKYWLIPQGCFNLYRKVRYGKRLKEEQDIKPVYKKVTDTDKLSLLKNKHKGERCFILASGPSISQHDLTILENEHCIAVSQFFLHPQIENIRPEYHCFAPQHAPFDDETNKIIFDNYKKRYTFPVKTFIGSSKYQYSYYNFLKKNPGYNIDSYFIDYTDAKDIDENNYNSEEKWDPTKQPFTVRTVIYEAIMMADYMGFNEIYLLGVDHDYLKDIDRTTNHHFYNDSQSFSDHDHLKAITLEDWFLIYHLRWKHYRLIQKHLNAKDVKIYNATPNSMVDVFPRISLESVISL